MGISTAPLRSGNHEVTLGSIAYEQRNHTYSGFRRAMDLIICTGMLLLYLTPHVSSVGASYRQARTMRMTRSGAGETLFGSEKSQCEFEAAA
jgi:hypothetical protein